MSPVLLSLIILLVIICFYIFFLKTQEEEENVNEKLKKQEEDLAERTFMDQLEEHGGDLYEFRKAKQRELDAAQLVQSSEKLLVDIIAQLSRIDEMIIEYEIKRAEAQAIEDYSKTEQYVDYVESIVTAMKDLEAKAEKVLEDMIRVETQATVFDKDLKDNVSEAAPYLNTSTSALETMDSYVTESNSRMLAIKTSLAEIQLKNFADLSEETVLLSLEGETIQLKIADHYSKAVVSFNNTKKSYDNVMNRAKAKQTAKDRAAQEILLNEFTPSLNALYTSITLLLKDTYVATKTAELETVTSGIDTLIKNEDINSLDAKEIEINKFIDEFDTKQKEAKEKQTEFGDKIAEALAYINKNLYHLDTSEHKKKLEAELEKINKYSEAFTTLYNTASKAKTDFHATKSAVNFGRYVFADTVQNIVSKQVFYALPSRLLFSESDYLNGIVLKPSKTGKDGEPVITANTSEHNNHTSTAITVKSTKTSDNVVHNTFSMDIEPNSAIKLQETRYVLISPPHVESEDKCMLILKNLYIIDSTGQRVPSADMEVTFHGTVKKFNTAQTLFQQPHSTGIYSGVHNAVVTTDNIKSSVLQNANKIYPVASNGNFAIRIQLPEGTYVTAVVFTYGADDFHKKSNDVLDNLSDTNIRALLNYTMVGTTVTLLNSSDKLIDYQSIRTGIAGLPSGTAGTQGWFIRFPLRETAKEDEFKVKGVVTLPRSSTASSTFSSNASGGVNPIRSLSDSTPLFGYTKASRSPYYYGDRGGYMGSKLTVGTTIISLTNVGAYEPMIVCRRISPYQVPKKLIIITRAYDTIHSLEMKYLAEKAPNYTYASSTSGSNGEYRTGVKEYSNSFGGKYLTKIDEITMTGKYVSGTFMERVVFSSKPVRAVSSTGWKNTLQVIVLDGLDREMGNSLFNVNNSSIITVTVVAI